MKITDNEVDKITDKIIDDEVDKITDKIIDIKITNNESKDNKVDNKVKNDKVDNKSKKTTLIKFIENNKHLARQGTEEWKIERMYSIGGSEIATIIGVNPFNTKLGIIAQKLALTHFNGNNATRWGNLFEDMTEKLFKIVFLSCENDGEIYSIGSVPHKTINEHRYSPDGLCVMTIRGKEKMVLLEFKSPYGSVPTSKVPKHYLPQVKAGLCTIDIADVCVFVNNMFRKCHLSQLDFSVEYDMRYHRDSEVKRRGINSAIANGIIFLYINKYKISEFSKQYEEFIRTSNDGTCDTDNSDNDYVVYNSNDNDTNDSDRDNDSDIIFNNDLDKNTYYDDGQHLFYKIYPNIFAYNTGQHNIESYKKNMIDFGDKNDIFNQMLELYKANNEHHNIISSKYMKPQINRFAVESAADKKSTFIIPSELEHIKSNKYLDKICKQYDIQKCINHFIKQCIKNDNIPIGYLPWKLFRSSNIIVDKDPDFLENIKHDIISTIELTKNILANATTDYEKAVLLNNYFEDNEISKKYIDAEQNISEYL